MKNAIEQFMETQKVDRVWGKYPERKEQVKKLLKRIKPIVDGKYIHAVDPFNIAFMWSPSFKLFKPKGLKKLADITTYHTWGYYGFFKPSLAEVIAQIPAEMLDRVIAFEIVDSPNNADDLNKNIDILNEGYHVATTRLYTK